MRVGNGIGGFSHTAKSMQCHDAETFGISSKSGLDHIKRFLTPEVHGHAGYDIFRRKICVGASGRRRDLRAIVGNRRLGLFFTR